jgi:hypothetical protein
MNERKIKEGEIQKQHEIYFLITINSELSLPTSTTEDTTCGVEI